MTVPAPIVQYLRKIRGTADAFEIAKLIGATFASSSASGTTSSPGKKRGAPYWARRIDAIDPLCPNGYGIEGDFANANDLSKVPNGYYLIFKYNGTGTDQHLLVLRRDDASTVQVEFPSGKTKDLKGVELMHAATDYKSVIDWLATNTSHATFVSDKRPTSKLTAA